MLSVVFVRGSLWKVVINQRFYPNLNVHQDLTISVFHFRFPFPLFPIVLASPRIDCTSLVVVCTGQLIIAWVLSVARVIPLEEYLNPRWDTELWPRST